MNLTPGLLNLTFSGTGLEKPLFLVGQTGDFDVGLPQEDNRVRKFNLRPDSSISVAFLLRQFLRFAGFGRGFSPFDFQRA